MNIITTAARFARKQIIDYPKPTSDRAMYVAILSERSQTMLRYLIGIVAGAPLTLQFTTPGGNHE